MTKQLLIQARDALNQNLVSLVAGVTFDMTVEAIAALQAAIDVGEPEPTHFICHGHLYTWPSEDNFCANPEDHILLYSRPAPIKPLSDEVAAIHRPLAPLTDEQIEKIREKTFSTNNPFCPVDSKSMRKAARAIEAVHGITEK